MRQQNAYYKANKKPVATKKNKKKKVAIPVQTPRVPPFGAYVSPPEIPLHYQRMAAVAAAAGEKKTSMCRAFLFCSSLFYSLSHFAPFPSLISINSLPPLQ